MQIIVGLGNPGTEYQKTRHNAGFMALDYISKDLEVLSEQNKFEAVIKEVMINGNKTLLVYPQTFMNLSGEAVKQILDFYKLGTENIVVLHDEVDLPLGVIKFTDNSGAAGHNGIKSIIDNVGTQQFRRIRIGVENRENKEQIPTDAFVLQKFKDEEIEKIPWEEIKARVLMEISSKI